MTDKPPPDARAFDRVQQLLDEAEAEELAAIPREQLEGELRKAGPKPGTGLAALEAARAKVDAEMGSKVVDLAAARQRRRIPPVTYVIAIAAGVALVVGLAKRDDIVAWLSPAPPPTTMPSPVPTAPAPPTEQQLAATLRDRAYDECKKGYLPECLDMTRAAQDLDPDYSGDPRWKETRSTVDDWVLGKTKRRELLAKPPLGPGERPLQRGH
jgi:hypothetical protein